MTRAWTWGLVWLAASATAGSAVPDSDVPEPFAPLEYLVGGWKGQARPEANRLKGWGETHRWAWKFAEGRPVGMSVAFEGDKVLKEAALTYDEAAGRYRLKGNDPEGRPVEYVGALDAKGKLTLDRVGPTEGEAKERLLLWPNGEKIRYTIAIERKERGAPRFSKFIETGLTREGEAFASGGSASNLPKCILTGGAATLTVTYRGKSYPVCCTGCRDEFNEDPEKYVARASARAGAAGAVGAAPASKDAEGRDEPKSKARRDVAKSEAKEKAKDKSADPSAKAATLLRLGQALEKSGNAKGALGYYKQVVKDHPDSSPAKAAGERIKAIESQ